jgi:hypothetical protein
MCSKNLLIAIVNMTGCKNKNIYQLHKVVNIVV